jgi:hypothetical protein
VRKFEKSPSVVQKSTILHGVNRAALGNSRANRANGSAKLEHFTFILARYCSISAVG